MWFTGSISGTQLGPGFNALAALPAGVFLDTVDGLTFQGESSQPTVPEPASLLLLSTGLGMLGLAAWRKRK